MKPDRKTIRINWFRGHSELKTQPTMKRRKEGHDYTQRCIYLITVCCAKRQQLFGTLQDADANHSTPWVQPSKLGMKVIEQWENIAIDQPLIKNIAFQLMPDHIHGILYVTDTLPKHIGHYVSHFKAKCTAEMRHLHECIKSHPLNDTLWETGYNDRILVGKGQLKDWKNYLRDNPRRLWVKRNHPEQFTARQGIKIGSTPVATMGNQSLLNYPYKIAVQCSQRMTSQEIEVACQRYLSMAYDGAVLISPCISPTEKEVMHRAFNAGMPLIILLENGFAPMTKPSGRQFDACANGRLLLVAPWEHHNEKRAITRQQCMALNKLASDIANYETPPRNTPTND